MPTRWAVRFAVNGETRFLSHHDMMRLMERAATRAKLPLSYSQGFNPRPRLSLPLPRPVGVASGCELMVLALDGDVDGEALVRDLGRQLPAGVTVQQADPLPAGRPPGVISATYELDLQDEERPRVASRIGQLHAMARWEIWRRFKPTSRSPGGREEIIDVRDRIGQLGCEAGTLSAVVLHTPAGSVKCQELLALVDQPAGDAGPPDAGGANPALARLRRTHIEFDSVPAMPAERKTKA